MHTRCAYSMRATQAGYGRSAMERLMLNGAPYTLLQVNYTYICKTLYIQHLILNHFIVFTTAAAQL
jgi:hypothetical protein